MVLLETVSIRLTHLGEDVKPFLLFHAVVGLDVKWAILADNLEHLHHRYKVSLCRSVRSISHNHYIFHLKGLLLKSLHCQNFIDGNAAQCAGSLPLAVVELVRCEAEVTLRVGLHGGQVKGEKSFPPPLRPLDHHTVSVNQWSEIKIII